MVAKAVTGVCSQFPHLLSKRSSIMPIFKRCADGRTDVFPVPAIALLEISELFLKFPLRDFTLTEFANKGVYLDPDHML